MFQFSLSAKVTLIFSILVLSTTLVAGYLVYEGHKQTLLKASHQRLTHTSQIVSTRLSDFVKALKDDIRFLVNTPAAQELVNNQRLSQEEWSAQLAAIFHSLLESRPQYFQVRLIGMANQGKELIRLEQFNKQITQTPAEQLQRKGDRPYFQETARLPAGAIYLSDINLNQEYQTISEPHIPTFRVASPIVAPSGNTFGIIIINVDLSSFFQDLQKLTGQNQQVYLTNEKGDYLLHPDPSKTFGFDLGQSFTLQNEFPQMARLFKPDTAFRQETFSDDSLVIQVQKVFLDTGNKRFLTVSVAAPYTAILSGINAVRNESLWITLSICMAGILLTFVFAYFLFRPLHSITTAVRKFTPQQPSFSLPHQRKDEIGILAKAFQKLTNRVNQQIAELKTAHREAEQASQAKTEFLSMISHEIRTPLNAIIGMSHLLEKQEASPKPELLQALRFSAESLRQLINDVLDFSKIEAGKLTFEKRVFCLNELMENIYHGFLPLAEEKGLQLNYRPSRSQGIYLQGDPLRLSQILHNLIGNAIKFTHQGAVNIYWELHSLTQEQVQVSFTLQDSGIGIRQENLQEIFKPFVQEDPGIDRKYEGTGLGLAISKKLIELQQGKISVKSQPGNTVFYFSLPYLQVQKPRPESLSTQTFTAEKFRDLHVLYVEDVEYNRFLVENYFEEWQIALEVAASGPEALAKVQEMHFDLILLDIQMPGMDGYEVARHIRQIPRYKPVPVIALTALVQEVSLEKVKEAGMDGLLEKPFTQEELARLLEKYFAPAPVHSHPHLPSLLQDLSFQDFINSYLKNPDKIRQATQLFQKEFHRYPDEFANALRQNHQEKFRQLYHRIHPHLKTLHLEKLDNYLAKVKREMELFPPSKREETIVLLTESFECLIKEIEQLKQ
ncbi:response regulator [Rapidithrix thailandica]|uniref:histidine kinase n=1 Tax=Rapidithrix thailandica TaxID=413964 RepID=A0AAW9RZ53_9BACT